MRALELKVPPLAVVLITAAIMWLASKAAPAAGFVVPARSLLSIGTALVGAVVSIAGVVSFRRAGTTVNPLTPSASSSLVNSGIYAVSRNPMYLGFLLLLLAWVLYLSNAIALICIPAFIGYMNRFQIAPEERALQSRFGPEFAAYANRVRRWI
jgi:protein-S-isoprenylcysteine O-methyltransferase Ste14